MFPDTPSLGCETSNCLTRIGKDADRLELNPSRTQYKERKAPAHKQWAQPV